MLLRMTGQRRAPAADDDGGDDDDAASDTDSQPAAEADDAASGELDPCASGSEEEEEEEDGLIGREPPPPAAEVAAPQPSQRELSKASKGKKHATRKTARQAASAPLSENTCAVCGAQCPSRSQLFKHIKATGHAAPKR
jgi:hypothetical protein